MFLSVVTRCYRRPAMLEANKASLEAQTDPDYEHIFLVDDEGAGMLEANRRLAKANPKGEYVLVLDDDDRLADPEAIAALKEAATPDDPALVIFRADHASRGILPDSRVWQKRPAHGHIGSCDFITRRDWWERHIHAFGAPEGGDYRFLWAMWMDMPTVVWLDRQLAAVQRISRGAPG